MSLLLQRVKNLFSVIPILKTERLLLRQMRVSDAGDMYEYSCIPEVSRFLLWSPHPNVAHTKGYLDYLQTQYKAGNHYDWAVVLRDSGKMIGTYGFAKIDAENNLATLHVVTDCEAHRIKDAIRDQLHKHHIEHVTIEIETSGEHCHEKHCHINTGAISLHSHHHGRHCH